MAAAVPFVVATEQEGGREGARTVQTPFGSVQGEGVSVPRWV
jgi:hypothetical protein